MNVLENTAYRLRVVSDDGRELFGRRVYLSQGTTRSGHKYYKDMRWLAFVWLPTGQKREFPGIPVESRSKSQLLASIRGHKLFTKASEEL